MRVPANVSISIEVIDVKAKLPQITFLSWADYLTYFGYWFRSHDSDFRRIIVRTHVVVYLWEKHWIRWPTPPHWHRQQNLGLNVYTMQASTLERNTIGFLRTFSKQMYENLCWNSYRFCPKLCLQSAQMSGGESPGSVSCVKSVLVQIQIVAWYICMFWSVDV